LYFACRQNASKLPLSGKVGPLIMSQGTLLSGYGDRVAHVEVDGFVTLACYNQIAMTLDQGINKNPGRMRLLEHIRHFSGMDPLAIIANSLFNLRNYSFFERVAVVSDNRSLVGAALTLSPAVMSVEVRTYPTAQFDDAKNWIVEGLPAVGSTGTATQTRKQKTRRKR
jgi:SpoIIAA-like